MSEIVEMLANSLTKVSDDSFPSGSALPSNLQDSYRYFLSICDGGYTKNHFFHFFGQRGPLEHNLMDWNRIEHWKQYFGLDEYVFVFAEDILGTQFCFEIRGNRRIVKELIPSTGSFTLCANSFDEFVQSEVLNPDATVQLGELTRQFFELRNEVFQKFTHISCKIPPILGGSDSDLNNLELTLSSTNLKIQGQIRNQVKALPPGTRIHEVRMNLANEERMFVGPITHNAVRRIP